jgi:long-chain fatty acid transport protein
LNENTGRFMHMRSASSALLSAFFLSVSGGVAASGFQLLEQSNSGLGLAYAGSAINAENASVLFYNPAAISKFKYPSFSGGVAVIRPSYKFSNDVSSNAPASLGSQGGDAGSLAALPNLYVTNALNDHWVIGLGLGSPFGLKTEYENDWIGRFQSTTFDIKTYNLNPSLAYKISDRVSLGFGLNFQRMDSHYRRQAATVSPGYSATTLTLDASGDALGWNAGAIVAVSSNTDIGISYRSKMFHRLAGTLDSSNPSLISSVMAKADITLPDTYILSIVQRLDERWEMLGDISRTNWSSIDKVSIVRTSDGGAGRPAGSVAQTLDARFRDTWRIALGGAYKITDAWKWKYGLAYDQTPVRSPEERLVSLPDNNRYWFSTGVQWRLNKNSSIDCGVAYLHIPKAKIDSGLSSAGAGQGRVVGAYDGSVWIVGVQASKSF